MSKRKVNQSKLKTSPKRYPKRYGPDKPIKQTLTRNLILSLTPSPPPLNNNKTKIRRCPPLWYNPTNSNPVKNLQR